MLSGDAGGRPRAALLIAVLAFACALLAPAHAAAEFFEVTSIADETDAVPGDEFCKTAAETCTLRAAIEESNALGGADSVDFKEEGLFDGGIGGTIALGSSLPTIEGEIEIFGECVPPEEVLRPCVGLDGPGPLQPALSVANTGGVTVSGLAITGARIGIGAIGTTRLKSLGNWLGVKLDRSVDANEIGILLGPGAERSLIGNGGETPNVFAGGETGLDVFGAAETEVLGNLFGVKPNGVAAGFSAQAIEVTGVESGPAARGTKIGTALSSAASETAACDGGCNVIAGGISGIELDGEDVGEVPATDTSIRGNFVGLGAEGKTPLPIAAYGINVGAAPRTAIGGPRLGEGNLFCGGGMAVRAEPAGGLSVRGNAIGFDGEGFQGVAPAIYGIFVAAESAAGPEATISGNQIAMQGGSGIRQQGFGAWIADNEITGAYNGIEAAGSFDESGNLIEGNLIEDSVNNAILLESDRNEVLDNELLSSAGAGVLVKGEPPYGVSGNRIGGGSATTENLISGSGDAAVRVINAEASETVVGRNSGSGNAGLFIDLVPFDPATEPKGPNGGLNPPVFEGAFTDLVFGSAKEGARVLLFRKAGASPGELAGFLGEAVADEDGFWEVELDAPVPPGTQLAATQTVEGRKTSELATTAVPAAPPNPGGGGGSTGAPACTTCAPPPAAPPQPTTKLAAKPPKKSHDRTARFGFKADQAGSTFRCKLDGKHFQKCRSPKVYKHLKPGKHVFRVRAVGPTGVSDPSPVRYAFHVLG